MVHSSSLSVQKSPDDVKPNVSSSKQPIRRKRLSEPRPHPSSCLNKRFWDEVRAGRLPKPPNNVELQMKLADISIESSPNEAETSPKLNNPSTSGENEMIPTSKISMESSPNQSTTVNSTTSNNMESLPSRGEPDHITIPTTNCSTLTSTHPFFGIPSTTNIQRFPQMFGFPVPSTLSQSTIPLNNPMPFWGFMPGHPTPTMPYQMAPPFMSLPPPYLMPCFQPMPGARPDLPIRQSDDSQTRQETAPQIQYVPFPVPIPIPLSNDFVLKHFGKQ